MCEFLDRDYIQTNAFLLDGAPNQDFSINRVPPKQLKKPAMFVNHIKHVGNTCNRQDCRR